MLEDPATPVFLGLTSIEWHAFGYGLKEGFKFWKRRPLAWDEANALARLPDIQKPLSPEIIDAVVKKYHYYRIGFDLPEDLALLGCVLYLGATNMPVLIRIAGFPG
jgi:hypothetical protein